VERRLPVLQQQYPGVLPNLQGLAGRLNVPFNPVDLTRTSEYGFGSTVEDEYKKLKEELGMSPSTSRSRPMSTSRSRSRPMSTSRSRSRPRPRLRPMSTSRPRLRPKRSKKKGGGKRTKRNRKKTQRKR
jgi:hypothetical protein